MRFFILPSLLAFAVVSFVGHTCGCGCCLSDSVQYSQKYIGHLFDSIFTILVF